MGQDFPPPSLSLYVHIPFCLSKCGYCSFFSLPFSKQSIADYCSYLAKEKALYRPKLNSPLRSLYFGGGSPALLISEQINGICKGLIFEDNAEITIEINPIQITSSLLSALKTTPINRLSLGVQSMTDAELQWLNRRHSAAQMPEKMKLCRDFGYDNISLDLIYGLPGSTVDTTQLNLDAMLALHPEHISCYLLSLDEDSARFAEAASLPDEDMQFAQYELIRSTLSASGFRHYEISNFAIADKASRHNLAYWHNNNYLALGASAAGWMAPVRYQNAADLREYYRAVEAGELYPNQTLCTKQRMIEDYLMMGLRLIDGIDTEDFKHRFGTDLSGIYGDKIRQLTSLNMLKSTDNQLSLTEAAYFVSNSVISQLIL